MDVEKVIKDLKEVKHEIKVGTASRMINDSTNAIDSAIWTIRELQSKKDEVCEWTLIDEQFNAYDTSCRSPWCLESGTPEDNKMNYCPYCGKKIKVVE